MLKSMSASLEPSVADECRQAMLIGGDLYELTQVPGTNKNKARKLLSFISSRIESQDELEKCVFKQFVAILRKEPSFEEIASRLETVRSEVEDRANTSMSPVLKSPLMMRNLSLSTFKLFHTPQKYQRVSLPSHQRFPLKMHQRLEKLPKVPFMASRLFVRNLPRHREVPASR